MSLFPAAGNTKKSHSLHRIYGQQSGFENEEYFVLSQHLTQEKPSDTHWPDTLTFKAYFSFNSIFNLIAGKRHESQPCSDAPALGTHQGLCSCWTLPSHSRLLLSPLGVKNTQGSWSLHPPCSCQFGHRCLLQTSGSSGMLQRISGRKDSQPSCAAYGHLPCAWALLTGKVKKPKEKPQGSTGEKGSAPTAGIWRVSQSGTWRNSLLQHLGKCASKEEHIMHVLMEVSSLGASALCPPQAEFRSSQVIMHAVKFLIFFSFPVSSSWFPVEQEAAPHSPGSGDVGAVRPMLLTHLHKPSGVWLGPGSSLQRSLLRHQK